MEIKKIDRKSNLYKYEFLFFCVFYILFSCIIFSISDMVVVNEIIGIVLMAIIYGLVNSEIFARANFGYYSYQAIGIPILLIFMYFQYHINEFIKWQ